MRIAQWLREQPQVKEVLHPALPGARGHELWKRDFRGASSLFGVILHPASEQRVAAMLDGMEIFSMGFSWGGFESLILPTFPERTRSVTTWSPGGPCLRLAVGQQHLVHLAVVRLQRVPQGLQVQRRDRGVGDDHGRRRFRQAGPGGRGAEDARELARALVPLRDPRLAESLAFENV